MGRGYIYEVSEDTTKLGEITEGDFYEDVDRLGIDYVADEHDTYPRDYTVDYLIKKGAKKVEKDGYSGVIITENTKMNYFYDRFAAFKQMSKAMTAQQFANGEGIWALQHSIEDRYGDCVVEPDSSYKSLDEWLRAAKVGVPYFFGNTILMH